MARRARRSQIQAPSASDRLKQTIEEAQVEAQALHDRLNHLEAQQPISLPPGLTLSWLPYKSWRRLVAKLILKALLVEHGTTFHVWLFHMLDTF